MKALWIWAVLYVAAFSFEPRSLHIRGPLALVPGWAWLWAGMTAWTVLVVWVMWKLVQLWEVEI